MPYTPQEERWNAISHAFGIVLSAVVGVFFIVWAAQKNDGWALFGLSLYLFGMFSSYLASTLYHATPQDSPRREQLRRWDHAAIYWHIAGSYSPIVLTALRGAGRFSRSSGQPPSSVPSPRSGT